MSYIDSKIKEAEELAKKLGHKDFEKELRKLEEYENKNNIR